MFAHRALSLATMLVASALVAPASAVPVAWHVSPAGSDSADGSHLAPFRTIQRAVDIAAAGDTVRLGSGTYAGTGNAPVTWRDRGLHITSAAGDRDSCLVLCDGQDGFRFVDTDLSDTHGLDIVGISFAGADTAVAVLRSGFAYAPRVWARVSDCAARDGNVGLAANGAWLLLDGCAITGNTVAGVAGGFIFGLTMDSSVFRANGTGLRFTQMNASPAAEITACEFVANGTGISYWQEGGGLTLRSCRVDSSTTGHGIRASSDFERLVLEGCDIDGNHGHGIANTQGTTILMTGGGASGNGQCGIAMAPDHVALRVSGARLDGNGEWGIGPCAPGALKGRADASGGPDKDPAHDIEIYGCDILANAFGGISLHGDYDPVSIAGSTIAANGGPGVRIGCTQTDAACKVEGVTIVANQGHGLEMEGGAWKLERALITDNKGQSVLMAGIGMTVGVVCSDFFGNLEGDWVGPLLPLLGADGNVQVDPLYCSPIAGDWSLRADSPAAPEGSSGCGLIGRQGVGCPEPPSLVAPVPADRRAAVLAGWPNPFNPRTTVAFDLPRAAHARLALHDVAGRLVRVLVDDTLPAGPHKVVWDGRDASGRDAASGLYVARLVAGDARATLRLNLVR